ncbi:NERD domain-containing protein [Bacillus sp. BGMRC 2118]|nr:NERD domain-containing protein [Bacillus sp. BGMRC 2118]
MKGVLQLIVKEIKIPKKLVKLEALLRRLPENHVKRSQIEDELGKIRAGYSGEQSLQYYFDYLPKKEYSILHNLRLFDGSHYFQIDFLLLSKKFILILEVKNMKGTLFFDHTFNQLIRTHNGKEEGFQDPMVQVSSHQVKLRKWLKTNKFSDIPIEYLVVVTNPNTIIKTNPNHQKAIYRVTRSSNLLAKVEQLENQYKDERLSLKEIKKLTAQLLKQDTPLEQQVIEQYRINLSEIYTGVGCPKCGKYAMQRQNRSWFCSTCLHWAKNAHLVALQDYVLLIGTIVTNRAIREFLHLPTRFVANKLLLSLNLHSTGIKKGKVYTLPDLDILQKLGENS